MKYGLNHTFCLSILSLTFFLLGISCKSEQKKTNISSYKNYYYPIESLQNGLFYAYQSTLGDKNSTFHWLLESQIRNDSTFLKSIYVGEDGYVGQEAEEWINASGAFQQKLSIHTIDSSGQWQFVPAKILSPQSFPFNTSSAFYHINMVGLPPDNQETSLSKERKFVMDTILNINGTTYECIRFDVKEMIFQGSEEEGYAQPEVLGEEYYAKGIGLVKYNKTINGVKEIEYELVAMKEEL